MLGLIWMLKEFAEDKKSVENLERLLLSDSCGTSYTSLAAQIKGIFLGGNYSRFLKHFPNTLPAVSRHSGPPLWYSKWQKRFQNLENGPQKCHLPVSAI